MVKQKRVTFTGERTGSRVTVGALIDVLEKAMRWLRTLDPHSPVDWEVLRVQTRNRLSLTFGNPNANGAVSKSMESISTLQRKREPKADPGLSDDVIQSTKELAALVGDEFKSLNISSPGAPTIKVTPTLQERVGKLAKRSARRTEWTTIEGVMDQVTGDIGGTESRFRIIHPLTGAFIQCTFDETEIPLSDVMKLMKHRVAAYGIAETDRVTGRIQSINVVKYRTLPDESAFASIEAIPKTNITGGMDSADYIERVRGGDD